MKPIHCIIMSMLMFVVTTWLILFFNVHIDSPRNFSKDLFFGIIGVVGYMTSFIYLYLYGQEKQLN